MKKIEINGISADNYGSNNYSCGMEGIVFSTKDITVEQVKLLPNVFLHPTVEPNSYEIFALLGTKEQYEEFLKDAKESHCANKAFNELGHPRNDNEWNKLKSRIKELEAEFKPWYE